MGEINKFFLEFFVICLIKVLFVEGFEKFKFFFLLVRLFLIKVCLWWEVLSFFMYDFFFKGDFSISLFEIVFFLIFLCFFCFCLWLVLRRLILDVKILLVKLKMLYFGKDCILIRRVLLLWRLVSGKTWKLGFFRKLFGGSFFLVLYILIINS